MLTIAAGYHDSRLDRRIGTAVSTCRLRGLSGGDPQSKGAKARRRHPPRYRDHQSRLHFAADCRRCAQVTHTRGRQHTTRSETAMVGRAVRRRLAPSGGGSASPTLDLGRSQ